MKFIGTNLIIICFILASCNAVKSPVDPVQMKKNDKTAEQMTTSKGQLEKALPEMRHPKLEAKGVNCFSKEVYEANQKDCGKEPSAWVCGCNSVSYPSECEAKKAGVKSFIKGRCAKEATDI